MLKEYKKKRNFGKTPEPSGKRQASGKHLRFVVQRHDATRLHYDFRLELDGVLKSWAVPKGPSMNPADKRLAVQVEDHPVDYIDFAGVIPEGNYGAGVVQVWDHGNYIPVNAEIEPISQKEALRWLENGEIKFVIQGKKLSGEFVLVRLKRDDKNWLLIKHNDEYAVHTNYDAEDLIKGKSKKEIFAKGAKGEKIWKSNRSVKAVAGKSSVEEEKTIARKTASGRSTALKGKGSSKPAGKSASQSSTANKAAKPASKAAGKKRTASNRKPGSTSNLSKRSAKTVSKAAGENRSRTIKAAVVKKPVAGKKAARAVNDRKRSAGKTTQS